MSTPEGTNKSDGDHGFPPDLTTADKHAYPFYRPPDPTMPSSSPMGGVESSSAKADSGPKAASSEEATLIHQDQGNRTRIVPPFPGASTWQEPREASVLENVDGALPSWLDQPGVPVAVVVAVAIVAGFVGLILVLATF